MDSKFINITFLVCVKTDFILVFSDPTTLGRLQKVSQLNAGTPRYVNVLPFYFFRVFSRHVN